MMTGSRNILWLLPLLLFVTWPLWGPGAKDFLSPRGGFQTAIKSDAQAKTFTMSDVFFTQDENGIRNWRIIAERMGTTNGESKLQMDTVDAVVYGTDQDEKKFLITSKAGLYDTDKQILTLMDNARVTTAQGYEIHSPVLSYQDKTRKIKTDERVRITGKDIDIIGKGFMYDMNSGAYWVGGRVKFKTW